MDRVADKPHWSPPSPTRFSLCLALSLILKITSSHKCDICSSLVDPYRKYFPPAAFYRPGRPNSSISRTEHAPAQVLTTQSPLSSAPKLSPTRLTTTRPSSAVSAASLLGVPLVPSTSIHAREHGLMMLQPLSHIHTGGSDDGSASGNDSTPEMKKRIHN